MRLITVTTRPPRIGEKNGVDYEFVTLRKFQVLKAKRQFLEWAKIFGQYYATLRSRVEEEVKKGKIVLLSVDVQGARNIRRRLNKRIPLFSIFVLPPSTQVLRDRLQKRATDSPDEIEKRIQRAQEEIKCAREYQGTVVNLDLVQSIHQIEEMISQFERRKK